MVSECVYFSCHKSIGRVFFYELSGCRSGFRCSHINFRYFKFLDIEANTARIFALKRVWNMRRTHRKENVRFKKFGKRSLPIKELK